MGTDINKRTRIRCYSANEALNWDQYLIKHSQSNFYQRYSWKGINERNFEHDCYYIGAEQDNQLVGLLPIVFVKSRLFGKILSSMPFVNFGGLCANSEYISKLILDEAKDLVKKCDADYLEIRSLYPLTEALPTSLNKISMSLDLDPDPDVIWAAFKSKHRTNIRRVYKEGVHVKQGAHELLDIFYNLMAESWKYLGTPIYKKSYFLDILNSFPNEVKIFVAYQNDKPIATAFNGYYKDTVEGMWAGALPQYRKIQPNYALYWEMIKDACENGCLQYHLGRSSAEGGAEAFKKKWNAYSKQLHWQYILNKSHDIPQLNVNNPKYQLAINMWTKMPLRFTTIVGPILAKSIP
ncbi:MAG: FemAB family PEP-CTERM system-associated protein [Gammaproteobacteria bacterium]|nr:FemAB family PEP-CTERM system-associated protein [Gammaproteobacteria bacterium]